MSESVIHVWYNPNEINDFIIGSFGIRKKSGVSVAYKDIPKDIVKRRKKRAWVFESFGKWEWMWWNLDCGNKGDISVSIGIEFK